MKNRPKVNSLEWFDYIVKEGHVDWYNGPYEFNDVELAWISGTLPNLISKNESILDVACGHGKWYGVFSKLTDHYVGVDASQNMVELAKKRNPAGVWKHVPADYTPTKSYDTIIEIWSLYVYPGGREKFIERFRPYCNRILLFEGHGFGMKSGNNWEEIIC
jgi:SAM-dependent methyltransferase|tara:strand:+ start:448 stop:930 length:483 start_codon:yes stop_codon:yes gene_type:complete